MTTVALNVLTKEMLQEYADEGESMNDALSRLLDESNAMHDGEPLQYKKVNIHIHEDTFERMKKYKLTTYESHSDTILRLLLQSGKP